MKKLEGLFKSKTFWANFIMMLIMVIPRVFALKSITIDAETGALIIFILNVILRWVTDKPLEEK